MADPINGKIQDHANFIWSVADTLRNHFKASEYGKTILPMTVLRRLDAVIEPMADQLKAKADAMPASATEKWRIRSLNRAAGARFHSISGLTLNRLLSDPDNIKANVKAYINGLSPNIRHVFIEDFEFFGMVDRLERQGILYDVIKHFAAVDLSPGRVTTIEMGYIFEHLLRRFNDESNAASGEHFTPREVIQLMTSLLFCKDGDVLASEPRVVSIHDPACGSGGMLATAESYLKGLNQDLDVRLFGQEVNPESYAICRSDMLITDHDPDDIRRGNTLTNDRFKGQEFTYQLCNPPYGTSYSSEHADVKAEHERGGGRFDVAIPPQDDGQLLFLLHMLAKMPSKGGRIAIIMSGSPLFNDSAGGKQSEIRRYILENDWLEGLISLPTNLFYNAQIGTYVWILSNNKNPEDKNRIRLINATNYWSAMTKNLGKKNRELTEAHIKQIVRLYLDREEHQDLLEMAPDDFGYRQITIQQPLRLEVNLSESEPGVFRNTPELDAYANWVHEQLGDHPELVLHENKALIRSHVENETGLSALKADDEADKETLNRTKRRAEKLIKQLINPKTYTERRYCRQLIRALRSKHGSARQDYNAFLGDLRETAKAEGIKLLKDRIAIIRAWITQTNPDAEPVIDKDVTGKHAVDPRYGYFERGDRVVTYEKDNDLADSERVPLDQDIVVYCESEVWPHVPDAWIDATVTDVRDGKIGKKGYEINFNRYFYKYEPPRPLEAIDAELKTVEDEIAGLLAEVAE